MKSASQLAFRAGLGLLSMLGTCAPTLADGDLHKLNHIIVIVQENHSFDNYFGALAYAPNTPYRTENGDTCKMGDHDCVDGLSACKLVNDRLTCANSNPHLNEATSPVFAFHSANRCTKPDLDHEWPGSHLEANFLNPTDTRDKSLNNGFVATNDFMLPDTGRNGPSDGSRTMGFFTQDDIPFYYDVAQKFAISDRYFSSVLGPTFPNRAYLAAATSFGHLTGENVAPPRPDGYKPLTGTIYDLLTRNNVNWAESFQDVPQGATFLHFTSLTE
jgi:phospholipase C